MPKFIFNIITLGVIILLDQLSKIWVINNLNWHQVLEIINTKYIGINLFLTYNTGAAFGFLHKSSGWQNCLFLIIAISVALFIIYLLIKNKFSNRIENLALLLLLGGCIGNMLDRLQYNYVIDFIDVYFGNYHWYTFNIADSAICLAVIMLLWPKQKIQ